MFKFSFSILFLLGSLAAFADPGSKACEKLLGETGKKAALRKLAADPVALIRGRDTAISEGTLFSRWDPKLKTNFYFTASDPNAQGDVPLVDPNAKAVAIFFHGSGTARSSGRNFIHNMNWLAQQGIAGVAIDLPFHASNKGESRLNQKAEFMKWLREVVGKVKESGKPIYLVGHSFGPEIALQYASEFPKDLKGGGVFLISGAWAKSPAHEWMYENVTTPGMEHIGGDQKVEDNPAGGDWAGKMGDQSDWHVKGIPPEVAIKLVVGKKDEWWPPPGPGEDKLPSGVRLVTPSGPFPNQLGNEGLIKKLKIEPEHTLNQALEWTKEKLPQIQIDVVDGYGHFIFESRDSRGGPLLNRLLMDFAGVEYSKGNEQNKRSPRLELTVLAEHNPLFRNWIGERNLSRVLADDATAERVLGQWKVVEFSAWKDVFETMKETDPDYFESRKYWLAKELKDMPSDPSEVAKKGWNANELFADLKRWREAREKGQTVKLPPDPHQPKPLQISSSLLGSTAQASTLGGSLLGSEFRKSLEGAGGILAEEEIKPGFKKVTFEYKGNSSRTWVVFDSDDPKVVTDFVQRAYEEAYRLNQFLPPSDHWEVVLDGVRVKGLARFDHKTKTIRLERFTLEPADSAQSSAKD